ncbi:MAG: hypothetical protein HQ567_08485 [Candidatus Nealsonbacteria bacterium]|nr:hypothetical protein [Candidatus Nealsonbacteria bacterium]
MAKSHKWTFKSRFRAGVYSWKGSSLASKRLKEAVSEIKKVAKSDPVLAAEGTVGLMERIWPALEQVDSSSGALGNAVYRTLNTLLPVLISAPADIKTRRKWADRLYEAVCDDGVEYLMPVEERWGEICGFPELANEWADRMVQSVRAAWADEQPGTWVVGATLCLSCLLETERFDELAELLSLQSRHFWHFDQFGAEALARQGKVDEAIAFAEDCRDDRYDDTRVIKFCERMLIEAGRSNEAYRRYALDAARATTNLTIFRKVFQKYPDRDPRQILVDLVEHHGNPGKWFAAAKNSGFLDLATQFASDLGAEPATLIRAARDFAEKEPEFAANVALCAIRQLLAGRGYEATTLDILQAHNHLITAAISIGQADQARAAVETLIARGAFPGAEAMLEALSAQHRRES